MTNSGDPFLLRVNFRPETCPESGYVCPVTYPESGCVRLETYPESGCVCPGTYPNSGEVCLRTTLATIYGIFGGKGSRVTRRGSPNNFRRFPARSGHFEAHFRGFFRFSAFSTSDFHVNAPSSSSDRAVKRRNSSGDIVKICQTRPWTSSPNRDFVLRPNPFFSIFSDFRPETSPNSGQTSGILHDTSTCIFRGVVKGLALKFAVLV